MNTAQDHRPAESARERILEAAFEDIHRHGYQGLRVDAVLDKAGLTKGAFYHHFASKQALGYAVVDEVIAARISEIWFDVLNEMDDPVEAIQAAIEKAAQCMGHDMFILGCPLSNLAQEMSPIDEGFRERTARIFQQWQDKIAAALTRGQAKGLISVDAVPAAAAAFIIASIEGCIGLAKNSQNGALVAICGEQMDNYLESLRP